MAHSSFRSVLNQYHSSPSRHAAYSDRRGKGNSPEQVQRDPSRPVAAAVQSAEHYPEVLPLTLAIARSRTDLTTPESLPFAEERIFRSGEVPFASDSPGETEPLDPNVLIVAAPDVTEPQSFFGREGAAFGILLPCHVFAQLAGSPHKPATDTRAEPPITVDQIQDSAPPMARRESYVEAGVEIMSSADSEPAAAPETRYLEPSGPLIDSTTASAPQETLAFAARLSLAPAVVDPDIAEAKTPSAASAPSQSLSQDSSREATSSPAPSTQMSRRSSEPDTPRVEVVKSSPGPLVTAMPLPPHDSGRTAVYAESESRTGAANSPWARMEQNSDVPAAQPGFRHDIVLRIPNASDGSTNVRFFERGSEIHVSVRTADTEMAQTLRAGLADLAGRLEHGGIRTEVWRPISDSFPDSQNRESAGRHHFGARGEGLDDSNDQRKRDKPRWVEELETLIERSPAQMGD